LVSAAVALDLDGDLITRARIAVGSVAMKPWRLEPTERSLAGMRIGSVEMSESVEAAFAEARPIPNSRYKVPLAQNAVLRAIEEAARA
jgi:xanthine dehydrogenase YagS FAD-binding subunit